MRGMRWAFRSLVLVVGLLAAGCSGDNAPKSDIKADKLISQEQPPACLQEGQKYCETLWVLKVCQKGQFVFLADCSTKKDAYGNTCVCSVTMGACQYAQKICP